MTASDDWRGTNYSAQDDAYLRFSILVLTVLPVNTGKACTVNWLHGLFGLECSSAPRIVLAAFRVNSPCACNRAADADKTPPPLSPPPPAALLVPLLLPPVCDMLPLARPRPDEAPEPDPPEPEAALVAGLYALLPPVANEGSWGASGAGADGVAAVRDKAGTEGVDGPREKE
jgi:hypothetical protein